MKAALRPLRQPRSLRQRRQSHPLRWRRPRHRCLRLSRTARGCGSPSRPGGCGHSSRSGRRSSPACRRCRERAAGRCRGPARSRRRGHSAGSGRRGDSARRCVRAHPRPRLRHRRSRPLSRRRPFPPPQRHRRPRWWRPLRLLPPQPRCAGCRRDATVPIVAGTPPVPSWCRARRLPSPLRPFPLPRPCRQPVRWRPRLLRQQRLRPCPPLPLYQPPPPRRPPRPSRRPRPPRRRVRASRFRSQTCWESLPPEAALIPAGPQASVLETLLQEMHEAGPTLATLPVTAAAAAPGAIQELATPPAALPAAGGARSGGGTGRRCRGRRSAGRSRSSLRPARRGCSAGARRGQGFCCLLRQRFPPRREWRILCSSSTCRRWPICRPSRSCCLNSWRCRTT